MINHMIYHIATQWNLTRLDNNLKNYKLKSSMSRTVFDLSKIKAEIKGLEAETKESDFWNDTRNAGQVQKKLSDMKEEVDLWEGMKKEVEELQELEKLIKNDAKLEREIEGRLKNLQDKYQKEEFRLFLSGEYDRNDAFLTIYSGAGGLDAQDWAEMLFRMYQRYFERKGYEYEVTHISHGEERGIKEASLEIRGLYAYGFLKGEAGVHRLVRISPYSAQKLRHTSFAMVDVMPRLGKVHEIEEIPEEDLRIDTYRASGPGGQNVNRRDTAVRVTHIPTGVSAASQSERSQAVNRERALSVLKSKLYVLKIKKRKETLKELKGEDVAIQWGSQIRSYVLHPYQMIKDHRTGVETSDVEGVLGGKLDEFIDANIKKLKS